MPRTTDDLTLLEQEKILHRGPAILEVNQALRVYGAWHSRQKFAGETRHNFDADIGENSIAVKLDPIPIKAVATIKDILGAAGIIFDVTPAGNPDELPPGAVTESRFRIDLDSATVERLQKVTKAIREEVERITHLPFEEAEEKATARRRATFTYLAGGETSSPAKSQEARR